MVQILTWSFLIDGTEVKDYILEGTKIEHQWDNQSGNTATLYIDFDVDNILSLTAGMTIVVSRVLPSGTTKYEFRGNVKNIKVVDNKYFVSCKDDLNTFKYLTFTKSYDKNIDTQAGEYSAIAEDIITNGGLTPDVQSSGTGIGDITVDKFISEKKTRLNRLNLISRVLNWLLYQDYDENKIKLQPKGFSSFSTTLIVGSNVYNVPRWEQDIEGMRNEVTIDGVFSLDTRTESETGDGVEDTWSFTYTPEATNLTVDGTLQKRGVVDSEETFDYSVDQKNKTYTFVTPPAGSAVIEMSYQTRIPTPVTADSPTSKTQFNLTQDEHFSFDDVVTISDAETRANQILELLEFGATNATLLTDEYNIKVGDSVQVEDPNKPDKNGEYIVYKRVINYPDPLDSIEIGTQKINISELFQSIDERIRALETTNTGSTGILIHLIKLARSYIYERRYSYVTKQDVSGGFVLDHPEYGILGTDELGDGGTSPSTVQIVQGNNTYKEFFTDTLFDGTGDATWNTTLNELSFTSGQTRTTDLITLGKAYTYYTVTLGTVTGTILTEISGDGGSTWETVTLETRTAFTTSTASGVKLRFTENAATTAKIETILGTYEQLVTPGIKCFLEE